MRPSGEPGKGEVLCTGMIGCSPTQRESNPSASACRATTATSTGWRVGNIMMPTFMGGLLVDEIWAQLLAGYLCDALASSLGHHAVVAGELMQNWLALTPPSAARAARPSALLLHEKRSGCPAACGGG